MSDPPVLFLLNEPRPILSLEFFPPKSEASAKELLENAELIATRVKPDFVSITDGASGSTRELTYLFSQLLKERFGWVVVPHLTCVRRSTDELLAIAESYYRLGIRNIMCLRGDAPKTIQGINTHPIHRPTPSPPSGRGDLRGPEAPCTPLAPAANVMITGTRPPPAESTIAIPGRQGMNHKQSEFAGGSLSPQGELAHASELVSLLKKEFSDLCLGVAGYPEKHPEASTIEDDIKYLKQKCDRGASWITTQLFFESSSYKSFVGRCRAASITQAILPGLLPIVTLPQAQRFCQMSGSRLPPALFNELTKLPLEEQWKAGVEWTLKMIPEILASGAPGVHLYILNKSKSLIELTRKMNEKGLLKNFNTH